MSENRLHIQGLGPGDVALLKDIAEAASDKSVSKWLTAMGLDPEDPIESQKMFGALRAVAAKMSDPEHVADMEWTRRTRHRSQGIMGKAVATAVGLGVLSAAHAFWSGLIALTGLKSGG